MLLLLLFGGVDSAYSVFVHAKSMYEIGIKLAWIKLHAWYIQVKCVWVQKRLFT